MRITKRTVIGGAVAAAVAVAATVGLISSSAGAATVVDPSGASASSVPANSIQGYQIKDGTLYGADLAPALIPWFTNTYDNTVKSVSIVDGQVAERDLAPAVQEKLNAPKGGGYTGKHWGTVHRNVIGAADAELGATSTVPTMGVGALNLHTASATDKVAFGNEVDFKGMPVKDLGAVAFSVYTTGENNAKGNNMPSIQFEIKPNLSSTDATYSSLVYLPKNGTASNWTTFDAISDPEKHWGLTGAKFSGTVCDINGSRCTWAEVLAYLSDGGDDAVIDAGVSISKGRDYAFSGAVDKLQFGGKTYDFEPDGVKVS
jgi:hypothetical protein